MLQDSVAELMEFKQKMSEREVAVQKAAKKQLADMESQVQELVKRLDAAAGDLGVVQRQATDEKASLMGQLAKVCPGHRDFYEARAENKFGGVHVFCSRDRAESRGHYFQT